MKLDPSSQVLYVEQDKTQPASTEDIARNLQLFKGSIHPWQRHNACGTPKIGGSGLQVCRNSIMFTTVKTL